jgi:[ribosomal protein S18]-alanine N-acetyltransferase
MREIRLMQPADLTEVLKIENSCFSLPWPAEAFDEHPHSRAFVLTDEGTLRSYIIYHLIPPEGIIINFATAPDFRRKGFGMELLEKTLTQIQKQGVRTFYLDVRISNISAQKIYRHFGFSKLGIRKNYYSQPPEDALVMVKYIK